MNRVDSLRIYYHLITAKTSDSTYLQQRYFENFPDNADCFTALFGYNDIDTDFAPAPLYHEAKDYIDLLESLTAIEKQRYYSKLISITGKLPWQADGVNYFKHLLIRMVFSDATGVFKIMAKQSDKDVYAFWKFFFSGPLKPKEIPDEITRWNTQFPYQVAIAEQAFEE